VALLIGMLQYIKQVALADEEDDFLKPNAAFGFQFLVLRFIPQYDTARGLTFAPI
jgi:hypothetical protein